MARRLTRARRLGAAALALAMVGCGEDASLDAASLVEGLPAAVVPEAPETITAVSCPELPPETVAQSLTCTALLAGDPVTVDLQVDEEGIVTAAVREPLLQLDEVAARAEARLRADLGVEVTVDCPGVVVVVAVGRRVRCSGTSGGTARPLVVEILDEDGTWQVGFGATGS